jgi:hypothetical protein
MAHQQSLGGTHNFAVAVYPELSKELGVPLKAREPIASSYNSPATR